MSWVNVFITANLIGIGSNFDNSGVGMAYGTHNIRFPHWVNGLSNVIGGGIALIGAYAGDAISHYLTPYEAAWAACVVLVGIGVFFWYAGYIHARISCEKASMTVKRPGWKEGVLLGLALSFTNLASGFGATISHATTTWAATLAITIWGYFMIWLGNILGVSFIAQRLGKYASLTAGCLLVLVGIHQVV